MDLPRVTLLALLGLSLTLPLSLLESQLWLCALTRLGSKVRQLFEELPPTLSLIAPPPLPTPFSILVTVATAFRENGGTLPWFLVLLPIASVLDGLPLTPPLKAIMHWLLPVLLGRLAYGPAPPYLSPPLLLAVLLLVEGGTAVHYLPPPRPLYLTIPLLESLVASRGFACTPPATAHTAAALSTAAATSIAPALGVLRGPARTDVTRRPDLPFRGRITRVLTPPDPPINRVARFTACQGITLTSARGPQQKQAGCLTCRSVGARNVLVSQARSDPERQGRQTDPQTSRTPSSAIEENGIRTTRPKGAAFCTLAGKTRGRTAIGAVRQVAASDAGCTPTVQVITPRFST